MQKTIDGFVRLGYFAKALVYILVGVLALKLAVGAAGGRITDPGGSLYVVLGQPFGRTVLLALAAGGASGARSANPRIPCQVCKPRHGGPGPTSVP